MEYESSYYVNSEKQMVKTDTRQARRSVAAYLKELIKDGGAESIAPLKFSGDAKIISISIGKNVPLSMRIMNALEQADESNSINSDSFDVETEKGRDRSVLDIWRHLRYYDKTLSIFEVMREIYGLIFSDYVTISESRNCLLPESKIVGHFCDTVARQVFNTREVKPDYYMYVGRLTEFGIYVNEWRLL